jgi:hypothetical protein
MRRNYTLAKDLQTIINRQLHESMRVETDMK